MIDTPVILAPMAGYTTLPFRNICRKLGSGLSFTEMVPVEGVRRRLPQTMIYLDSSPEERPVGAHIYGSDPDAFAAAAEIIES
ncbi:MAG: tRNA dihydrouridine synthase DusB, partial [bacterium]|nr:tRNA dihydrouridine synthase DusB [bacterium]